MNTKFELEEYSLTKLHVEFKFPDDRENVEVSGNRMTFDYDIHTHKEEQRRFRMCLRFKLEQCDSENIPVAYQVQSEMYGFLVFDESCEWDECEKLVRINGLSLLYSTLRGYLATVGGLFPMGKIQLPAIMPQDIVRDIELRKAEERNSKKRSSKDQSQRAKKGAAPRKLTTRKRLRSSA